MNPEEEIDLLEEIINQILRGIQDTLMSGERLTDEFQGMLADELLITHQRIDQLRQELEEGPTAGMQPIEPPLEPGMDSSNVNSFGYDPENERLLVKFNGKDERDDGPVYGYGGVPKVIFDLFQKGAIPARTDGQNKWGSWYKGKVPSLGASMYTLIKEGGYPYERLS